MTMDGDAGAKLCCEDIILVITNALLEKQTWPVDNHDSPKRCFIYSLYKAHKMNT